MSGNFWLDWAALAVSLHNTILLLWLGLTVFLNADRRTWGIWLASGSLLLACIFFVSHTVILAVGFVLSRAGLDFWWYLGWVPVITLPFGWYLVTLWYAGFWEDQRGALRLRQQIWFFLSTLLNVALVAAFAFANPIPSFTQILNLDLSATPEIAGIPILLIVYALDIFLCVILSLDALRRPAPSARIMGNLARSRARPWLIGTAILLLIVGALVGIVIAWAIESARHASVPIYVMTFVVAWFDLIIAILLALAIIFVGQAVAFYELFTGKILPRRGLFRQWRSAVILAGGYGVVVGWALIAHLQAIYIVMLTTALMTIFYALFSWRSYVERERYIRDLRPFVTSQHLYDQLLQTAPSDVDAATPFRALCRDVLGARVAHLAAIGPLAPLVPSLAFPDRATFPAPTDLARFEAQTICLAIDPAQNGGAVWAIPLWSERGLIGVLRLGEKIDGGLYAQEEIEIARVSGERLIDTLASAELARRLMALQRQRLTETQLLDRRARRVLHDDILPKLHAAILTLNADATVIASHPERNRSEAEMESKEAAKQSPTSESGAYVASDPSTSLRTLAMTIETLTAAHRETSDLLREMPTTAAPEVARLGLVAALKQAVDDEWAHAFDRVEWSIEPDAERDARTLPTLIAETLFFAAREAIRNAARYGRDDHAARPLTLRVAMQARGNFEIVIEDDGIGLHKTKSSDLGSGHGLALHSAMLAVIGATLSVEAMPSGGTRVVVVLPRGEGG